MLSALHRNPVHNAQAVARIWRYGQTRPCYVYRMLYKGTLEDRLYAQSNRKEELFCRVSAPLPAVGVSAPLSTRVGGWVCQGAEGRMASRHRIDGLAEAYAIPLYVCAHACSCTRGCM
jgi:hypothetical protein